jgi:hypothetical protein
MEAWGREEAGRRWDSHSVMARPASGLAAPAGRFDSGWRVRQAPGQSTLTAVTGFGLIKHVRIGGLIAKRWPVVGGVLLVAAVGGLLCWSPWDPREPVYEGKPLTYWLSFDHPTPKSLLGDANAVPFLLEAQKLDSWFGAAVYRKHVWPNLPASIQTHLPAPVDNDARILKARDLLERMGPMARPFIPAMIRALSHGDPSFREGAFHALSQIDKGDKRVVAVLTGLLTNKDPVARELGTNALLLFDPGAALQAGVPISFFVQKAAEDLLIPGTVRAAVADAMANGDTRVMTAWTAALRETNIYIRATAASFLEDIDCETAVKEGVKTLKDGDAYIRQSAVTLVGQAARRGGGEMARETGAIAALVEALHDTDPNVRYRATNFLFHLDPEAAAKAGVKGPSP